MCQNFLIIDEIMNGIVINVMLVFFPFIRYHYKKVKDNLISHACLMFLLYIIKNCVIIWHNSFYCKEAYL